MKIAAKRGRFPAKNKKRLKALAHEIRTQKQWETDMAEARERSPYYHVGLQILQACDWYYHDGLDIETVMETISRALSHPVSMATGAQLDRVLGPFEYGAPEKQPPRDFEREIIFVRHELRPHDTLTANMIYLIDNAVGMWYDGYYSEKLAMMLLQDYATVLVSGWSGRKYPLEHRAGR